MGFKRHMEGRLHAAARVLDAQMQTTREVLKAIGGDAFTDAERHDVQLLHDTLAERRRRVQKALDRAELSSAGAVLRERSRTLDSALSADAPEALLAIFRARHTELEEAMRADDADSEEAIRGSCT